MKKCGAIILAAGKGSRMHSDIPKQFLELRGKPIFLYSILAFAPIVDEIVLVTGEDAIPYCEEIISGEKQANKLPDLPIRVVKGGAERYLSSAEGLKYADDWEYVMIHDAARACVTADVIRRSLKAAEESGSGVTAVRSKDTIKRADAAGFVTETPARESLWVIQTPQTFKTSWIVNAYKSLLAEKETCRQITDDAMVLETEGIHRVRLSEGDYRNIKITTPEDLILADAFMKAEMRSETN